MKKAKFEHTICKPCWELKYCPYGPLVERLPPAVSEIHIEEIKRNYEEIVAKLSAGKFKTENEIDWAVEQYIFNQPLLWEFLKEYDAEELNCSIFGHVCPVFIYAEETGETKAIRNISNNSRHISREVMLKVIRRDGQICQMCFCNVPDSQVEFDHIIPFSKGGPATESNLRVVCKQCNSKKSNSLEEILHKNK